MHSYFCFVVIECKDNEISFFATDNKNNLKTLKRCKALHRCTIVPWRDSTKIKLSLEH